MASTFKLVFAVPLLLQLLDFCWGNKVGVDYGMDADYLPSPEKVAQLVRNHNIQYLRIYNYRPEVLRAFSNTGIELMVGVPNADLSQFQSQPYVDSWLRTSILPYREATKITHITVGVEVTNSPDNAANLVVRAMRNVVSALKSANLQGKIKVSTPLSFGVLSKSYPPSEGAFNSGYEYVLRPLLDFLEENQSPFMVNLYPFYAIEDSSLDAVLFKSPSPIFVDQNTGLSYKNIFDAQLDAVFYAIANLNFRTTRNTFDAQPDTVHFTLADTDLIISDIIAAETGWPTRGSRRPHASTHNAKTYNYSASLDSVDDYANIDNAQTYNTNLISHVMGGSGTPARPGANLDVYIFSLFNENLKQGPETERNFGLFYPDMTSVYNLVFPGKGTGRSWCVASRQASNSALQNALDWACGPGKADCSALQPDQQCFEPNNLVSHASFAFNNYYQKNGLTDQACRFGGTGIVVYNDPSYGNCIYNVKSRDPKGRTWCVASSQAPRSNLQNALDWACGPGKADCSEIQPNQKCFQPDTLLAHASFAFNNYYQKNGATDASCSFRGNAIKVDKDPSYGNCFYH
ncbi:glucan endo-1,3-beta-glucosidase 13 isoform X4 [Gossypium raimondii]|uniref:glucan endo-1,3-beta-glucosidase 13 isoform X4 n=1 Tax=Gossypium raimondii TaxID=29730 RepID=UPI00227C4B64|nr:glucan endo-1,3-beta-glucosidase 13 isoform X4 [Gossypium raimondii]